MGGLLALVCLLHVLGGAVLERVDDLDLWQNINNLNNDDCSYCDLENMVQDCPLDVMFVLDMSDSVSVMTYQEAKNYTARQMKAVTEAFQDTQVGFLAFSNIVYAEFPLQTRTDVQLQELMGEVQSLPQHRYETRLADALLQARQALTTDTAAAAAAAPPPLVPSGRRGKVIVLVSDGCPDNDSSVRNEALQASLDHIAIVSVRLDEAYMDLLSAISVRVVDLGRELDWRSLVACPASFLPPVKNNSVCTDFVVAMDGSDSVRRWEQVMRDYLAFTAMRYADQDNAIGVVVFGTDVNTQSLDTMIEPIRDKWRLAERIEQDLSFPSARGTGTTQAILRATAYLRDLSLTGGPSVGGGPRALVVVTDGPALNPQGAREVLASVREEGLRVVVVGVGKTLKTAQLRAMAGPGSLVLQVDSYLQLYSLDLAAYVCQEAGPCWNRRPCNPGQIRDFQTCNCVCPNRCPVGQSLDPDTCACLCPNAQLCNPPQILDPNTCVCDCPTVGNCTVYEFWDPGACTCVPLCPVFFCGPDFVLNPLTCQCECGRSFCPQGQVLDFANCVCGCPNATQCYPPQILNPNTCTCVCPIAPQCYQPQTVDPNTCACGCPDAPQCNFPQSLDYNTCTCGCPGAPQCFSPQTLDLNACTCECPNAPQCSYPQSLDPSTCTCGCPNPPQCDPPYRWNPSTCACECGLASCPPGQVLDSANCVCETPTTTPVPTTPGRCSNDQNHCQNDQPAVLDCQGRCICQCNTRLYRGFYCDLPIKPSLCDNCTQINGHYLAGVEGRCDMYVVCAGGRGGSPYIMECPPGTIFKQDGRLSQALCNHPGSSGTCPTDPCRTLGPNARYANSRSCGRYWQCDARNRTSSSQCCPRGQGFDRTRGLCVPDPNCPNDCDPNLRSCNDDTSGGTQRERCPYRAVPSDPQSFYNPSARGVFQSCGPTDYFNDTLCRCLPRPVRDCQPYYDYNFDLPVTSGFSNVEQRPGAEFGGHGNVAYFGGNSRIILYRFSGSGYYTDYFEISLRVRPHDLDSLSPGEQMAIVSNGDCGGRQSLGITMDGQNVYFRVEAAGGTIAVEVPYETDANGWLDVRFQYERTGSTLNYLMTGTVNGQSSSDTVFGVIQRTTCALQVGHGQGLRNLTGCVDDFVVWRCKPNGGTQRGRPSVQNRAANAQNGGPWSGGSGSQNNGRATPFRGSWYTQILAENAPNRGPQNSQSHAYWNAQVPASRNTQNRSPWAPRTNIWNDGSNSWR